MNEIPLALPAPNGNGNGHQYSQDAIQRGQLPQGAPARYTGEILLRTRPKTYRKVIELLSRGESGLYIAQNCKVSRLSVDAIRERESATIEQRKNELTRMVSDVAHIGMARVADTIGRAKCRDAIIGTGIAVDKLLALTGQLPAVQVAVIMPSETERVERRQMDAKLDALMARLNAPPANEGGGGG